MRNIGIVIKEIYLRHIKSWSFVFLVISPFLFGGLSVGITYLQNNAGSNNQIALVSANPTITDSFKNVSYITLDYTDEQTASDAATDEDTNIEGYLTVTDDNGQITATYHSENSLAYAKKITISERLSQIQDYYNRENAELTESQQHILEQKLQFTEKIDEKKENQRTIQTITASALALVLYIILITYISTTAQEVASEKGSKIMEIVFSSIKASHYFFARMIGICLVIFTHIGIYLVGGLLLLLLASQLPFVSVFLSENPNLIEYVSHAISLNTLAFSMLSIYMYILVASFAGSMVSRIEDAGKALSPIMMLIVCGFLGVVALGPAGDTLVMKIGSYIPLISTFFMPFRAINGYANSVEAWISFAIAFVFAISMTIFIGRIYASLVLQTDDSNLWKAFKRALHYR